jgi:hypothetical protein
MEAFVQHFYKFWIQLVLHEYQSEGSLVQRNAFLFPILVIILFTWLPLIPIGNPHNAALHSPMRSDSLEFNGTRAYAFLEAQCAFGPRPPGSDNLTRCGDYIIAALEAQGWPVIQQNWTYMETPLRNIIAGAATLPKIVLLAHYDTRPRADNEPNPANQSQHILGANDGGSGTAALLELAAVLPDTAKNSIVILLVDAEDSGGIGGWEWIVGSTHYVASLSPTQVAAIEAAILLDMMGDADLQLKREGSSTQSLVDAIWQTAATLGYGHLFQNIPGYTLVDDHRPFLQAGIPAVDIIDFDYPYWHTLEDTLDKCSPASLEAVGRVVEQFVQDQLTAPATFRNLLIELIAVGSIVIVCIVVVCLVYYWRQRRKRYH